MELVRLKLLTYEEEQASKIYLFYPSIKRYDGGTDWSSRVVTLQQTSELGDMKLNNHDSSTDASNYKSKSDRVRELSSKITSQVIKKLKDTGSSQLLRFAEKSIHSQQAVDLLTQKLMELTTICEQQAEKICSIESRLEKHEKHTKFLAQKLDGLSLNNQSDYQTIRGYCKINKIRVSQKEARKLGTQAGKVCRDNEFVIKKVADDRHGEINAYPIKVLEEVMKPYKKYERQ
jgi:hypothetical protein